MTGAGGRGYASRVVERVLGLFWNRDERRLRAPWRLALALVCFGVFVVAIGIVATVLAIGPLVTGALSATVPEPVLSVLGRVAGLLATAGVAVVAVWVAGRFLDRRPFVAFGFRFDRGWWLDFAFGLALGAGLMTAVFLIEVAAGWVAVSDVISNPFSTGVAAELLGAVVLFVAVGIYEELVFRGYLLKNAAEGLVGIPFVTPRRAIALATVSTAGLFGAVHAANPNATFVSTTNIAFAGLFLATGYVLTAELAIPIGLHITWNLFQGTVFGFPVSGMALGASVLVTRGSGPQALTGGSFGPEAGLVGLGAMIAGIGLTVAWVRIRYGSAAIAISLAEPTLRWRREVSKTDRIRDAGHE